MSNTKEYKLEAFSKLLDVLDELREFLTEHADTEVEPILAPSPAQTPAA